MIKLPDNVYPILEKVSEAEDDFANLFKGLSIAQSSILAFPSRDTISIHGTILLHLIANLVELQGEVARLKGRVHRHIIGPGEEHTK